jgi:hypothetical protein
MPKDGKQQAFGAEQNRASIDKEPLVRVVLADTINNKIAAVGYIKIKIVENDPITPVDQFLSEEFSADVASYTLACGNNDITLKNLKWHEVEESIIAKLGMSKTVFESKYELDGFTSGSAKQFDAPDAKGNANEKSDYLGEIVRTTADIDGTQTEILKWTIKNQQAYAKFKAGATSVDTWVRYALKSGETGTYKYFYVKFTWAPNPINITPSTAFGDNNKIQQYWYATNSEVAGSGKNEIHANVEVYGTNVAFSDVATLDKQDPQANDEFVFDIRNTLVGHKIAANALTSPYAGLNPLDTKLYFISDNGLYASNDGTYETAEGDKLYATRTKVGGGKYLVSDLVAEIDPVTGIVKYADNAKAKELLNNPENSKLMEQSVTATVSVKATACVGPSYEIPVDNDQFKVKFLRPITISDATATFEDAVDYGSTSNVNINFTDWRNRNFSSNHDYFRYYGVIKVNVDTNKGKTNINGNPDDNLNTVAPELTFEYIDPVLSGGYIQYGNYGKLKYQNNGSTVGDFKVWFPIEVVYDWGTLKSTIECTVKKTQNHARSGK